VTCPTCGVASRRVHSRYRRRLGDVALGGRRTVLVLSVRRLFCDQPGCRRRTFAEQVEGLTGRHVCARPLLYLNGRLMVRGYLRCGCETLRFNAWSTTRELPWEGPKGATFSLVWTDPWSRKHPAVKFQ
jgi:hypothetical protein